jgi:hypothetical protein
MTLFSLCYTATGVSRWRLGDFLVDALDPSPCLASEPSPDIIVEDGCGFHENVAPDAGSRKSSTLPEGSVHNGSS